MSLVLFVPNCVLQKDDLDGEVDLKSCVKVSEFDVEKNYGFQIQVSVFFTVPIIFYVVRMIDRYFNDLFPSPHPFHFLLYSSLLSVGQTREAVVTLSAMTAGIRRNWIEVLRKCVRPSSSPDLTQ